VQVDHVQAKQQVLARAAGWQFRIQNAIAGCDPPQVDVDRIVAADPIDPRSRSAGRSLAHRRRGIRGLIDEQSAAVRFIELADSVSTRP
jgi:hypothetical protein